MIKKPFFYALIASVMSFLIFSDVCYAVIDAEGIASVSSAGILDITDIAIFGEWPRLCNIWHKFGQYPNIIRSISSGFGICSGLTPTNLETGIQPDDNGWHWVRICNYDPVTDCHYYPDLYRIGDHNWASDEPSLLTIISPENGSTITDLSTNLVVDWSNIDHTYWTDIKIAFNDYLIGETSKIYDYTINADSGEFSIPLSIFGISKNGYWTFNSVVENATEINFDVPNPAYGLTFNVVGLPTPYAFTDFDTWYSENVSDYETPSVWAKAMVGFLQPIFEKVGEFGNRITSYLNILTAYEKGFSIGSVFPVVIAYIGKIDLFFGGFPIMQFFQWAILIMIGLFSVKIILKLLSFIPFFGGGG